MASTLNDGKEMCCLGFLGKFCQYTDDELLHKGLPGDMHDRSKWPKKLFNIMSGASPAKLADVGDRILSAINDDINLTDDEREVLLKEKFVKIGIEVEFV